MIEDLMRRSRSYRRFHQEVAMTRQELEQLIALVRLTPSGSNLQPLKFFLSCDEATNRKIFSCLTWAASLPDWDGPEEGERPAAYIVILQDREIWDQPGVDHGIAAQSILLGAAEKGWGGCIIKSVDRKPLHDSLALPEHCEILLVLALGRPNETVVLDDAVDGQVTYWRDAQGVHHVPKRPLRELLLN